MKVDIPDSGGQLVWLFLESSRMPNSSSEEDIILPISLWDSGKPELKYLSVLSALLDRVVILHFEQGRVLYPIHVNCTSFSFDVWLAWKKFSKIIISSGMVT